MAVISSWWVLQFYPLLMSQIHNIYKIFIERKSDVTVFMKWSTGKHYDVNQLSSECLFCFNLLEKEVPGYIFDSMKMSLFNKYYP